LTAEIITIDNKDWSTWKPKPGIYADVPNDVYHKEKGFISSSQIKVGLGSPHYYKFFVKDGKGKKEETKQLSFGTLVHTLVLEPEKFDSEYVVMPDKKLDMRKAADKAWKEAFDKEHEGKTTVSSDDFEKAVTCRDSVYAHQDARRLLELPGISESSVYVELDHMLPGGEVVKVKVRVRPDRLSPDNCIIDLKTAKNVARDAFERDAFGTWRASNGDLKWGHYSYHYDLSAALYVRALEVLDQKTLPFHWIVVKNDQPWETAVYTASRKRIKEGDIKLNHALTTIIMAERSGKWEFQEKMEEI
jgi:hypothetical protein